MGRRRLERRIAALQADLAKAWNDPRALAEHDTLQADLIAAKAALAAFIEEEAEHANRRRAFYVINGGAGAILTGLAATTRKVWRSLRSPRTGGMVAAGTLAATTALAAVNLASDSERDAPSRPPAAAAQVPAGTSPERSPGTPQRPGGPGPADTPPLAQGEHWSPVPSGSADPRPSQSPDPGGSPRPSPSRPGPTPSASSSPPTTPQPAPTSTRTTDPDPEPVPEPEPEPDKYTRCVLRLSPLLGRWLAEQICRCRYG